MSLLDRIDEALGFIREADVLELVELDDALADLDVKREDRPALFRAALLMAQSGVDPADLLAFYARYGHAPAIAEPIAEPIAEQSVDLRSQPAPYPVRCHQCDHLHPVGVFCGAGAERCACRS